MEVQKQTLYSESIHCVRYQTLLSSQKRCCRRSYHVLTSVFQVWALTAGHAEMPTSPCSRGKQPSVELGTEGGLAIPLHLEHGLVLRSAFTFPPT